MSLGIAHPALHPAHRDPTPREVVAAMRALSGFEVEVTAPEAGGTWRARIQAGEDGPWTVAAMQPFAGEEAPRKLRFEGGWPDVIVLLLQYLVPACGPLVLVPDSGDPPVVLTGHGSADEILSPWGEEELF